MNILSTQNIFSILSVLLSGLVAGLFYGYACSVNPGLGRLNDLTVAGNVPLNETLANFSIEGASPEKLLAHREKFESRWNQYHLVRTAASILCFLMTILSLLKVK